ncbi:D-alanine--D-alanine ligase family protein [Streptosporangium sp. V21-05]|uniref:D-alanine--D-alanine ligase family protein n=1 Tax=Streptosporangium sp. V21-05 TaxID=3446115 RepID=UPI003F52BFE1
MPFPTDAALLDLRSHGRIGVLTGGVSRERERSLLSGRTVHASLVRQGFFAVQIDTSTPDFVKSLRGVDVAFLAIAGQYAEDGKLQGLLEHRSIPYTGSGVLASALAMHKPAAKTMVAAHGVNVLPGSSIDPGRPAELSAKKLMESLHLPIMLKPVSEGGSIDMRVARAEEDLTQLIEELRAGGQALFAERYCPGRSVTAGVLQDGDELRVLPVLETRTTGEWYDHATKNNPELFSNHCPADLPASTTSLIGEWAKDAHRALGCSGYSRSDFVVTGINEVFWLETNTLPGLSGKGNMATMATAAGLEYDGLITHILSSALTKQGYQP